MSIEIGSPPVSLELVTPSSEIVMEEHLVAVSHPPSERKPSMVSLSGVASSRRMYGCHAYTSVFVSPGPSSAFMSIDLTSGLSVSNATLTMSSLDVVVVNAASPLAMHSS